MKFADLHFSSGAHMKNLLVMHWCCVSDPRTICCKTMNELYIWDSCFPFIMDRVFPQTDTDETLLVSWQLALTSGVGVKEMLDLLLRHDEYKRHYRVIANQTDFLADLVEIFCQRTTSDRFTADLILMLTRLVKEPPNEDLTRRINNQLSDSLIMKRLWLKCTEPASATWTDIYKLIGRLIPYALKFPEELHAWVARQMIYWRNDLASRAVLTEEECRTNASLVLRLLTNTPYQDRLVDSWLSTTVFQEVLRSAEEPTTPWIECLHEALQRVPTVSLAHFDLSFLRVDVSVNPGHHYFEYLSRKAYATRYLLVYMSQRRATEIAIALRALDLPVLQLMVITDAVRTNQCSMHYKWVRLQHVKHARASLLATNRLSQPE